MVGWGPLLKMRGHGMISAHGWIAVCDEGGSVKEGLLNENCCLLESTG